MNKKDLEEHRRLLIELCREKDKTIEELKQKLDMQEDYINFLESQNLELKDRLEDLE